MRNFSTAYVRKGATVAAVAAIVLSPVAASAATNSANTTVRANIGSTISITSSGTVTMNITPVTGGSQSSISDTVTVSTNNATGYTLTLADADATTDLANGSNVLAAHAGTMAVPTALANNTWGFAVASAGGFDTSYTALSDAGSSTTKWAGVPATGAPVTLKTTGTTAAADTTTVWYSAKADTTKPNGTYEDTVTYTATTN